jgi:hypothetical protein
VTSSTLAEPSDGTLALEDGAAPYQHVQAHWTTAIQIIGELTVPARPGVYQGRVSSCVRRGDRGCVIEGGAVDTRSCKSDCNTS